MGVSAEDSSQIRGEGEIIFLNEKKIQPNLDDSLKIP